MGAAQLGEDGREAVATLKAIYGRAKPGRSLNSY